MGPRVHERTARVWIMALQCHGGQNRQGRQCPCAFERCFSAPSSSISSDGVHPQIDAYTLVQFHVAESFDYGEV